MEISSSQDRGNLPSASSIARYAVCPGSFLLERDLPESTNEYAASGTRIHAFIADGNLTISDEEKEIASSCLRQLSDVMSGIEEEITDHSLPILETRFWYGETFSGQVDRIDFLNDEAALVVDYKTGRIAPASAESNLQLRAYAVLAKQAFPDMKRIYVSIIQPLAGKPTVVCYQEEDLRQSEQEIMSILSRIFEAGASLNPTPEGCKHCKAKLTCTALQGDVALLESLSVQEASVSALTVGQLSRYLTASYAVEEFIDSLRKEAKHRLSEGEIINGYELKPGKTTRSLTSAEEAFGKLQSFLTPSEFANCCKASLPQIEKAIQLKSGLKAKEAKDTLAQLLSDTIEIKTGEAILTRI